MLLYGIPFSAYCAKVRIALRLKGIAFREVPPPGGYRSAAYRAIVPTGTVPALDIGDRVLFESDAIVEYLDEIRAEPPLLPAAPADRAQARSAARYHDTRVEPVVRTLFPHVGASSADPAVFEAAVDLLGERLARLGEASPPAPFIAGPEMTAGDLGYPGTLMMAERLLEEGGCALALAPPIAAWRNRLLEEPAVRDTVAEMAAALDGWIATKRQTA
ncbi:MAG: glutathione S-transferase family protein, partial [Pseudomonadota bacterium]